MPQEKRGKTSPLVVIDTNVWVSAFISPSGHSARILDLWLDQRFDVITALPLLEEISRVLQKPRLQSRYGYHSSEIKRYLTLIMEGSQIVVPQATLNLCRDPKDNHLLEAALESRADFLVSRDDDLKGDEELIAQMKRHGVKVMTISGFLKMFTENDPF